MSSERNHRKGGTVMTWLLRLPLGARLTHSDNLPTVTDSNQFSDPATAHEVARAELIDLEAIHRDLEDVEAALARLDAGTYWTDEVTGDLLDEHRLSTHPLVRRNPVPEAPQ